MVRGSVEDVPRGRAEKECHLELCGREAGGM